MAVKTVEMVRKIRNEHYEQTKGLKVEEQMKIIKRKSGELQKRLKMFQRPTSDKTAQAN